VPVTQPSVQNLAQSEGIRFAGWFGSSDWTRWSLLAADCPLDGGASSVSDRNLLAAGIATCVTQSISPNPKTVEKGVLCPLWPCPPRSVEAVLSANLRSGSIKSHEAIWRAKFDDREAVSAEWLLEVSRLGMRSGGMRPL
jgi:hypothetical protein